MQIAIAASISNEHDAQFVVDAERLGASSVWVAEAWGYDALTPLAFLAARTSTIKLGSGIVQIGTSGPQVREGWHGVPFANPVQSTRETIEIVRKAAAGERLDYEGKIYRLPLPGGAGRAIRSMAPPTMIPMYVAALGPRNLELTGELAEGWIGNAFIPERGAGFIDSIRTGAARSGRNVSDMDLLIPVGVEFTEDVETAARRNADGYAFTIGAMGSAAAEAVPALRPLARYARLPFIRSLVEPVYDMVAKNRHRLALLFGDGACVPRRRT